MYAVSKDSHVVCGLCPRACVLREGARGACRVRVVSGGRMIAENYGAITSMSIDPIEKKPLYHFAPGAGILSVGTYGCNLSCKHCQNWEISQRSSDCRRLGPDELASFASSTRDQSVGVAYTYSEPVVWYEYVHDSALRVREAGLVNVLVTNGEINPEPLKRLLPLIDAMNIDLKAFTDEFYRNVCGGSLAPVLDTIRRVYEAGCHVELTTLVIPGLNDSGDEMDRLASWVSDLSPDIPLHISRYFPNYRMTVPPTPIESLRICAAAAKTHLNYVYVGNASIPGTNDTICPSCGEVVIERRGYSRVVVRLAGSACPKCGLDIPVRLVSGNGAGYHS